LELIYLLLGDKDNLTSVDKERNDMFPYFEINMLKDAIDDEHTVDLISKMLIYDPNYRISAKE
ncbi:protein kinase 6, partial [Plasmodium gaboni]